MPGLFVFSLHHDESPVPNESAQRNRFPEVRMREGLSTRLLGARNVTGEENRRLPGPGCVLGCSRVVERGRREDRRLIWWRAMEGIKLVTVAAE